MSRATRAIRVEARLVGRASARSAAVVLGRRVREARRRRRASQAALGTRVGISASWVSAIERGDGAGAPLEVWFALSDALAVPLRVEFQRDPVADVADGGHLKLQELALRLGRQTNRARALELPTKPADPAYSIDVCLRDDTNRVLFIEECWNTFGNINASVRSTRRKIADAEEMAAAIGGEAGSYRVAAVWIVRDTRANRALLGRYPEVFAAAFTASSAAWVRALTQSGVDPPTELGLVWATVSATDVFARRQRARPKVTDRTLRTALTA